MEILELTNIIHKRKILLDELNRLDIVKWISLLIDRTIETIQTVIWRRKKKTKKDDRSLVNLWNSNEWCNMCVIGVLLWGGQIM